MQINVSADDIKNGVACSLIECPIGHALFRATSRTYLVIGDWAVLQRQDGRDIQLPAIAQEFIQLFDIGAPVQPFSFEVDYP